MVNFWFKNPRILIENMENFFPREDLTEEEKCNSLVRLAVYYALLIIILGLNTKWLSISLVLILLSFFLGYTEKFDQVKQKNKCYRPTENNPFMNFTVGDYYNNPNRNKNCPLDQVYPEVRKKFLKGVVPDPNDLWGNNTSDRNFYTMPVTTVTNNQTEFGNWLYGGMGKCKSEGKDCLNYALSRTGTGMFDYPKDII